MTTGITQKNRFLEMQTRLGKDYLILTDFTGSEHVSQLFKFTLTALSADPAIQPEALLNQPVSIRIGYDEPRVLHGIVSGYATHAWIQTAERRYCVYQLTVEPWLSQLQQNQDYRIFQNKTVLEIVQQVLAESDALPFETHVTTALTQHSHRTQYQESTWAFIERLLAEEGLSYYFTHTADSHTLIITDDQMNTEQYPEPLPLSFHNLRQHHIYQWQHQYHRIPEKIVLGDYDFTESYSEHAGLIQEHTLPETHLNTERFIYPGGYTAPERGKQLAIMRAEQQYTQHQSIQAESTCWTLQAGMRFTRQANDWLTETADCYITTLTHHAHDHTHTNTRRDEDPQHYHNCFTCIPHTLPFYPPIPKRPEITGTQTALVAGPKSEGVYTNTYGQIQVQFHWDRYADGGEGSSPWLRTTTLWAGAQWGSLFIPRVDQEVVIAFSHGDPDRPLALGTTYHSNCPPPYRLPQENTKTVLRSATLHNSAHYNELSFDDQQDNQLVYFRAEKNYDKVIQNNADTQIENDCTLNVKGNYQSTIEGDTTLTLTQGSQTINLPEGHLNIEAQRITFSVGDNCIEINKAGILIRGPVIDFVTEA